MTNPSSTPAAPPSGPRTTLPMTRHKALSIGGAGLGLLAYLATAALSLALPAGHEGVLLFGGILGMPNAPTLGLNALLVVGMVLGFAVGASLFVAIGAVAGAGVAALTRVRASA